jgi:1,2-diacylglycerol 3-alpha-glucosyltransferase
LFLPRLDSYHGEFSLILHYFPSLEPGLPEAYTRSHEALEQRVFNAATSFLVTSEFSHEQLRMRGFAHKPILVIPPALSVKPGGMRLKDIGIAALMVSHLVRAKNVLEFLHELAKQTDAGDSFLLTILGSLLYEPEYAEACQRVVRDSPFLSHRVRFSGACPPDGIGDFYEASNLFLSSSLIETYGLALHEAGAFSLPIIACEGGNTSEHIRESVNGYLAHSAAELAADFLSIVRNPSEHEALLEGAEEMSLLPKYTWHDAAKIFMDRTSQLVAK